ncbi:MAG: tetratricopeptide repeat protein [Planctomycetes bacterium]|nr:tetratricopeptide repeat protein [Planctomycetota bacterium]
MDEAEHACRCALACYMQAADRAGEGLMLGELGSLYIEIGRADDGIAWCQASLEVLEREDDHAGLAQISRALAVGEMNRGNMEAARVILGSSINHYSMAGDEGGEAGAWLTMGNLYRRMGEFDSAATCCDTALDKFKHVGNRRGQAKALANRGVLYRRAGNLEQAEKNYREAIEGHREVENPRDEGIVLGNLANLLADTGRADEAERCYWKALELHAAVKDRRSEGLNLANLAGLYIDRKRYADAEQTLASALEIHCETGDRRSGAFAMQSLGRLYTLTGRLVAADQSYTRACEVFEAIEDWTSLAESKARHGLLKLLLGEATAAQEFHDRAAELLSATPEPLTQSKFTTPLKLRIAVAAGEDAVAGQLLTELASDVVDSSPQSAREVVERCTSLVRELNAAYGHGRVPMIYHGHLPSELEPATRLALLQRKPISGSKLRALEQEMLGGTDAIDRPAWDWHMPEAMLARQL